MSTSVSISRGDSPHIVHHPPASKVTYDHLTTFHLRLVGEELSRRGKSLSVVNNHRTAINKWLEYATWKNAPAPSDALPPSGTSNEFVGEEMAEDFERCLSEHLGRMRAEGLADSTVSNRSSLLSKCRESYLLLRDAPAVPEEDDLPAEFSKALGVLIERTGKSAEQIGRQCDIAPNTLRSWVKGRSLPSCRSVELLHRLEEYFGLKPDTLRCKLPGALCGSKQAIATASKDTPHRAYVSEMLKKPYKLAADSFNVTLRREWERLYKFYTDPAWVAAQGLERQKRGWRTRQNNGRNATAEIKLDMIQDFFGWLRLPRGPADTSLSGVEFDPENEAHVRVWGLDPHQTGQGMDPGRFSLALFTKIDLVYGHLEFLKGRAFGEVYNSRARGFLNLCRQLVLPKKGYLWQHGDLGTRLSPPVTSKKSWRARCEETHRRLKNIITNLESSERQGEHFTQSRDTSLVVVKPLIRGREHPISVLTDMAEGIRGKFEEEPDPQQKAILFRDLIEVELLTSNPMRATNMVEMKYKPGCAGGEADPTNLYKVADGSYRLKYEVWELKNGAQRGRYDLPVNPEYTKDLDEYFSKWRPLLADAEDCDLVFRPWASPKSKASRRRRAAKGLDTIQPMTVNYFSRIFSLAAREFIDGCVGFGCHAARHLVATEWLKNYPGAYPIVATILHDSEKIVKEVYSWVEPDDIIRFWVEHLGAIIRKSRGGC